MIRKATLADSDRIIEMGQRFIEETTYKGLIEANPEKLSQTIANVINSDIGVVLLHENGHGVDGMIALVTFEHPFSAALTASELVWWVEPEARGSGIRLLKAAEDWARDKGAKVMQMIAPTESVGALYERCGYRSVETAYQRTL